MRTLGDMDWLNDYIGIPYEFAGRDMTGLDCYGLVKLVYHNEYGLELPDWQVDTINLREVNRTISSVVTSGDFDRIEAPVDGSFVIAYRNKAACHIGLYYAGCVLHAFDNLGVIYQPLSKFKNEYVRVEFGEWHP